MFKNSPKRGNKKTGAGINSQKQSKNLDNINTTEYNIPSAESNKKRVKKVSTTSYAKTTMQI